MRPLRQLVPALAAAALLAAAPSTLAKGMVRGEVCEANGCTKISQRTAVAFLTGGSFSAPAPQAGARVVTVTVTMGGPQVDEQHRRTLDYAPSLGVVREHVRGHGTRTPWTQLDERSRAIAEAAVTPAKPAPARASVARRDDGGGAPAWWLLAAGAALLVVLARYATSALKARPRAS